MEAKQKLPRVEGALQLAVAVQVQASKKSFGRRSLAAVFDSIYHA